MKLSFFYINTDPTNNFTMDTVADYITPLTEQQMSHIPRKYRLLIKFKQSHNPDPSHFLEWLKKFIDENHFDGKLANIRLLIDDNYINIIIAHEIHYSDEEWEKYVPMDEHPIDCTRTQYLQLVDDICTANMTPSSSKWSYHISSKGSSVDCLPDYPVGETTENIILELLSKSHKKILVSSIDIETVNSHPAFITEKIYQQNHIDWATVLDTLGTYVKYQDTAHEYRGDSREIIQIGELPLLKTLPLDHLFCQSETNAPTSGGWVWDQDFIRNRQILLTKYLQIIGNDHS